MDIAAYELTEAGLSAWRSGDRAIPEQHRLVLWLIEFYGNDYVERLAERYSTDVLSPLLDELEELKLIRRAAAPSKGLAALDPSAMAFSLADERRFEDELRRASESLAKVNSYISEERLKDRKPLGKPRTEAVVLIVEDDPDQLALADLRVSMEGYTVWVAQSARALHDTLATKGRPDALLLDVMLPDLNGFEILRKLRSHRVYADLPVILLTAKTGPEDIAMGLRLGADAYVTKPYSKRLLAGVLEQVLVH